MNTHSPYGDLSSLPGKSLGWLLMLVVIVSALLSVVVPPVRSPDEADHIRRAYFLSQGVWQLQTVPCSPDGPWCRQGHSMSGGYLDTGLQDFLVRNDVHAHSKESTLDDLLTNDLRWRGENIFVVAPGTGFYFPLIYTPQAIGLSLGKALGLSISHSYYLARGASILAGGLVLALAFFIYLPSPAVCALLLLPMSLFQMASASIDFLSTALAVLAISCFVRICRRVAAADTALFCLMAVSIFVVGSCRAHLAAMVLLQFSAAWQSRRRLAWGLALGTTALILLWMATVIPTTVDFRTGREATAGQVAAYYVSQPVELLQVFWRTLTNPTLLRFYGVSFFGVFADRSMDASRYYCLAALLTFAIVISLASWREWCTAWLPRAVLMLTGLFAAVLAFLAMLVAWSPHPAQFISGVQGRYLPVPAILVLSGLGNWAPVSGWLGGIRKGIVLMFGGFGLVASVQTLLAAFYTPLVPVVAVPVGRDAGTGMQPSSILHPGKPLMLRLPEGADTEGSPINWIGIQMATYSRQLTGRAELTLFDREGHPAGAVPVDLGRVRDNEYLYVPVPPGLWNRIELRVLDGDGGLSVWTPSASGSDALPVTGCMALVRQNGFLQYTRGCVPPK